MTPRLRKSESKLLQMLHSEKYVDSGAGESVCPVDAFPSYKTITTGKTGTTYRAAGGQKLTNVGEIRPNFKSNGIGGSMAFQATTDVQNPWQRLRKSRPRATALFWRRQEQTATSRTSKLGNAFHSH